MIRRSLLGVTLLLAWNVGCAEGHVVGPPGNGARHIDARTADVSAAEDDGGLVAANDAEAASDGAETLDAAPPAQDAEPAADAIPGAPDAVAFPDAAPPARDAAGFPDAAPPSDAGAPPDGGVGPSTGCGMAQSSGTFNGSIMVNGQRRTFLLSVPANYNPNNRYPLLFGFHGSSWLGFSYRNSIIDIENTANGQAIFVYPDGLIVSGGQTGWDLGASGYDIRMFDTLLASLAGQYCVDMSRVFAFGTSYGGFFSNALGCARPNVLRGIASVSGGGPSFQCAGTTSWFGSHSQDDNTVGFGNGTRSRDFWRNANQCANTTTPSTPSPCVSYNGCANGRHVEWCGLASGGHNQPTWVGGAIWNYFSRL